jgi:hypothetical protein
MRIHELLEAKIGKLSIGNYVVAVDSHAMDRAIDRFISPRVVDKVLNKIPNVSEQIDSLEDFRQFYIVDNTEEISLGLKKVNDRKLYLNTVIDTASPYGRGIDDIFTVE